MSLDRTLPVPLYHQLKEELLSILENGNFELGTPLPTEAELMEKYGISRITVRRAMYELEQEGHIYRMPGNGTFVSEPKISRGLTKLTSFAEDMQEKGRSTSSKLLIFRQEPASALVAEKLGVEPGTAVWFIERLRSDEQSPIAVNLSYLRLPPQITITAQELNNIGSLWALLESKGITLADADRTIEAIPANQTYAQQLHIAAGAPLLLIDGVVYDNDHVPVEYHQVINRGDRYQYTLYLKR
jgi:GntR family transcriptional regulator